MSFSEENVSKTAFSNFKTAGRILAMQFLYQFDLADRELNNKELELFWSRAKDSLGNINERSFRKSRAYAESLISGIIEHIDEIDDMITRHTDKWHISRMVVIDRNVIRVAVFEMMYKNDIPPLVSINEAIEIAKDFGEEKSTKFINGILNSIKDTIAVKS